MCRGTRRRGSSPAWSGDYDPILVGDSVDPLGEGEFADLDRSADEGCVHQVYPAIDSDSDPGVDDIEPFDRARHRNDIPILDLVLDPFDPILGDIVPGAAIDRVLDPLHGGQVLWLGELTVRVGVIRHELDPSGAPSSPEFPSQIPDDALDLIVIEPVAEVV